MPVPTDTFWNIKKLNWVFAASAVALFASFLWMIDADHRAAWREWQHEAQLWDTAMTRDAVAEASRAEITRSIELQNEQLKQAKAQIPQAEIDALTASRDATLKELAKMQLPTDAAKGEIGPLVQQIEAEKLRDPSEKNATLKKLNDRKTEFENKYKALEEQQAYRQKQIDDANKKLNDLQARFDALKKRIDDLERERKAAQEKLDKIAPEGVAAKFVGKVRNAPLMDWFNPSEKISNVVVSGVRTDLNFLTTETTDRCMTCHVNIDNPRYESTTLVAFMERQVGRSRGQDVDHIARPIVMVDFWENALTLAGGERALAGARDLAYDRLAKLYREAGLGAKMPAEQHLESAAAQLDKEVAAGHVQAGDAAAKKKAMDAELPAAKRRDVVAFFTDLQGPNKTGLGSDKVPLQRWYDQLIYYRDDLQRELQDRIASEDFTRLRSQYRVALVASLNKVRAEEGKAALSDNAVLLAHPRLELFVDADSKHPVKLMGCTACHEGSGQETAFVHSAHTPREMWVDAKTGAPVADYLVGKSPQSEAKEKKGAMASGGAEHGGASILLASNPDGKASEESHTKSGGAGGAGGATTEHAEHSTFDGLPFRPIEPPHATSVSYTDPSDPSTQRTAVQQTAFWTKAYDWHEVHYTDWEKPMHALDFTESSCMKCHTQVYDLRTAAPTLFEGRRLFAQMGCANCHAVTGLADALDVKKVGPSLVHVKDKLAPQMVASWIWSPKAFRPTTKMPHLFMLENNSGPADILRTRTEVTAITWYLQHIGPGGEPFKAEPSPVVVAAAPSPATQPGATATTQPATSLWPADYLGAPGKDPLSARLYIPEPLPTGITGDKKNGRMLFVSLGCLACHTNLAEHGEEIVIDGLLRDAGLSEADQLAARGVKDAEKDQLKKDLRERYNAALPVAKQTYEAMSYNDRAWAALKYAPDRVERFAPELSGVGTKLKAGRTVEQARAWVYDWIRQPRRYSHYTTMPSLRLSEQEAMDLSEYLLALERPTYKEGDAKLASEWRVDNFSFTPEGKVQFDPQSDKMLTELCATLLAGQMTLEDARKKIQSEWSLDERLRYLGQKSIAYYSCNACHAVNGFENSGTNCPSLDDFGLKDPHKLDFGYFDGAFDKDREKPITITKVEREGLVPDAPSIRPDSPEVQRVEVSWEEIENDRRSWAYHKLHNPRVYDRGRVMFDGEIKGGELTVGKPYDKLKMPKFFLSDGQVHALVTYVTAIRKPLVSPELQRVGTDLKQKWTRGAQVAALYNCYGCHNIEGNAVHVQDYYDVHNPDGSYNYDNLNNAPPRLLHQGAKTNPDWVPYFLQNVYPIRLWLTIRMPSFPFHDHPEHPEGISEYFAGWSKTTSQSLSVTLAAIDKEILDSSKRVTSMQRDVAELKKLPPTPDIRLMIDRIEKDQIPQQLDWHTHPAVARPIEALRAFAFEADLAKPKELNPRDLSADELRTNWNKLVKDVRFLTDLDNILYPYAKKVRPQLSDEDFARGEMLFNKLGCITCHRLGDEATLTKLEALDKAEAAATQPASSQPAVAKAPEAGGDEFGGDETPSNKPMVKPIVGKVYPNLINVGPRLQWNYVHNWVEQPATIQPGTKMPKLFPDDPHGVGVLPAVVPDYSPDDALAMFGWTGEQQIEVLMNFLYAASDRHYTPGAERLLGVTPKVVERFSSLPKPLVIAEPASTQPSRNALAGGATSGGATGGGPAAIPDVVAPTGAAIELHDGSKPWKGTRIVGVISTPEKLRPKPIDFAGGDAYCVKSGDKGATVETFSIEDGKVHGAFVAVRSGPVDQAAVSKAALLDQHGCIYNPRVLGVMVGQTMVVKNSDKTLHNFKYASQENGTKNEGTPQGSAVAYKFNKPEEPIPLKCDVHGWMLAYLHVLEHPYFAVTDENGAFEITGLPPGHYTLDVQVDGSKLKPATFEVDVKADTSVRADAAVK